MKKVITLSCMLLNIGAYCVAQSIIPNDTFDLSHKAYDMSLSPNGNQALIFYTDSLSPKKQKGMAGLYDLKNKAFVWTRECSYKGKQSSISGQGYQAFLRQASNESKITPYGTLIVEDGKCTMVGSDGNNLWQITLMPVLLSTKKDLLLGYSSGSSAKLRAYRLSDGQQVWQQKVSHSTNWGWNQIYEANDSLVIVAADELNFLNPLNGNLYAYDSRNGFQRTGNMLLKALAVGVAGGVMGGLTGVAVIPTGNSPFFSADVYTNTCSNIFRMGGKFYFSDRNRLSCLDANGKTIWTHEFPSKVMGYARITGEGNRVTVVNYGYGLAGGTMKKPCGQPFIASFDATNGDELYTTKLTDNKDMMTDAYVDNGNAFIMFPDHMVYKELGDSAVRVQPWNTAAYGSLVMLPTDTIYTFRLNDQVLTPLHSDSTHCIVITDKGKMKVVNKALDITDDFDAANYYQKLYGADGMAVVTNEDGNGNGELLIIKDDGEPVGRIGKTVTLGAAFGDDIYILSEKQILKINFKQIKYENSSADGIDNAVSAALR